MKDCREHVAIAMSVYRTDKADTLLESLTSIFNQTYKNIDVYLQVDGYISDDVRAVIEKYRKKDGFYIEFFQDNMGLAFQLNRIVKKVQCSKKKYSYIARMDADDICTPNRIDKQVDFFRNNNDISVLGSGVIEFSLNKEKIKKMPTVHEVLESNIIKRCPFNHPTVMFNLKCIDINHIIYDDSLKNTQDYYLWVDLLYRGYRFANLDEQLLYFRVNENFHQRRGFSKAINDVCSRYYAMKKLNKFSFSNLLHTFMLGILRISPRFLKEFAYDHFR